eukprot:m.249450 g.249450  ORF g.249450 m.249450 type:complete len:473 (+) comp16140_c1_seq29:1434-2852(+)
MLAGSAGYNSLIHAPSSAGSCSTTTTSSTSTSTVTTTTTSSTSSFTTSTVTSTTSSITSSTSTTSSITTATSTTTSVSTSTVSSVTSSSTTVSSVTSTTLTTMTTTGCRLVQAAEYHNEISVRALANGESAKLTWYLPGYHALSTQDVRVDVITFGTNTIFEDPHVEYELGANVSARVILYLIQLTANNNADEEYLPVRLQVSAFIPAGVSRPDFEWVTDLEYFSTPSEIQLKKYIETNKTISLLENDLEMLDQLNKTAGQGDGDSNSNKLIINLEEGEAAETQTKASHSCYDYTLIIVLLCLFFLLCCCCPLLFVIWWLRRKQEEEESELDEVCGSNHCAAMSHRPAGVMEQTPAQNDWGKDSARTPSPESVPMASSSFTTTHACVLHRYHLTRDQRGALTLCLDEAALECPFLKYMCLLSSAARPPSPHHHPSQYLRLHPRHWKTFNGKQWRICGVTLVFCNNHHQLRMG